MPTRRRKKHHELQDKIAKAVLGLLPIYEPNAITSRMIAQALKTPTAKIEPLFTTFDDCIPMVVAMIDAAWETERPHSDPQLSAADQLFDVLMARFDVMEPYREGLAILSDYARSRPQSAVALYRAILPSMEAAFRYIEPRATPEHLRILALAFVYGLTFEVWRKDTSADKARTMAALDRRTKKFMRICHLHTQNNNFDPEIYK